MNCISLRNSLIAGLFALFVSALLPASGRCAVASNNIPLDSPIYSYLGKLAGFGLIRSDIQGIRPFSKAEAARLLREAENNAEMARLLGESGTKPSDMEMVKELFARLRERLAREVVQPEYPATAPAPWFELAKPEYGRLRYAYIDGVPRSYFRPVWDPGDDGVFGIGSGLRPKNYYPSGIVYQRGYEGTPLFENNEGNVYRKWSNLDLRVSLQGYSTQYLSFLVEPQFMFSSDDSATTFRLNKGYLKVGGGPLELEIGRDANWFGLGERGNVTLTNNAQNLDFIKLSSPEPIAAGFLGALKYSLIFTQMDNTLSPVIALSGTPLVPKVVAYTEREPYLVTFKLALKPASSMEIGINFARMFGGPGTGGFGGIGGVTGDTANSLAGIELRFRLPWLRNAELYGEFSGEDVAGPWPIVESYVAGIYFPRLTAGGRDDFRFEFFYGNQILYTNTSYPGGYMYHNMPLGHSQGGATIDFYGKYRHWFTLDTVLTLEYFHTERGTVGRVPVNDSGLFMPSGSYQTVERKDSGRVTLNLPVPVLQGLTTNITYGIERVRNHDLLPSGSGQTNQIVKIDLNYNY